MHLDGAWAHRGRIEVQLVNVCVKQWTLIVLGVRVECHLCGFDRQWVVNGEGVVGMPLWVAEKGLSRDCWRVL